jgi:hypothetical protein
MSFLKLQFRQSLEHLGSPGLLLHAAMLVNLTGAEVRVRLGNCAI